jgi:hypothetical protein
MSTFAPLASPQVGTLDLTKHVNYTLGMVLGVDDFTQEFAYLDGRDRRIARDLAGYGVVAGLGVTVDVDATRGPRVRVLPGEAVTPSGRFVTVAPTQCAYLNDWLSANPAAVDALGSPPAPTLALTVVVRWLEAATDQVPIPGEPCRTDTELMAPSRLQDCFELELRPVPPPQAEEDAVRRFVAWARQIPVVDTGAPALDAFATQLSAAAGAAASPPDPLAFLSGAPPAGLSIARADAGNYARALLAFWVTELRAALRSAGSAGEADSAGGSGSLDADADCLALARLEVPLAIDAVSGTVRVADATTVTVDTSSRASLVDVRLLQELLLGTAAAGGGGSLAATAGGRVGADGSVAASFGGLTAASVGQNVYVLGFPAFDGSREQLVAGQPVTNFSDAQAATFEVLASGDEALAGIVGGREGVVVRVRHSDGSAVKGGFTVRIDQYGSAT